MYVYIYIPYTTTTMNIYPTSKSQENLSLTFKYELLWRVYHRCLWEYMTALERNCIVHAKVIFFLDNVDRLTWNQRL